MPPHKLRILRANEIRQALPMRKAIEAMRRAFIALSRGEVQSPPRASLGKPGSRAVTLVMSALLESEGALSVKAVSVFPQNAELGLPVIHSAVLAIDPETGRPRALLDGAALTAIRTGAASGAATDLLARADSRVLAVFGTGPQAATQVEAVCAVRPIEAVRVRGREIEKARTFAENLAGQRSMPSDIRAVESSAEALSGADIVCTATTSASPVFDDADLPSGAHINAIGSFQPAVAEIPPETVARATVFVDQTECAWEEAGDLIQPLQAGRISRDHVRGEIGQLAQGLISGRAGNSEITLFKSVGNAAQDAAALAVALAAAEQMGIGMEIDW